MMAIDDYAREIFTKESIIVPKNEKVLDRLEDISQSIFNCPKRNQGRDIEQVRASVKFMAGELALEQQCSRLIMNPRPWSEKDPLSYAYDNIDQQSGQTVDVKRWPADQPDGSVAVWFAYPAKNMETLKKHINLIDYIVGSRIVFHEDCFEVGFHMIADGKTFLKYMKPSMYKKENMMYNHNEAMRNGHCLRNMNIKYRNVA